MKKGRTNRPGIGLRSEHYGYLETRPKTNVNWFEAVSENYMDTKGRPFQILNLIREDYPVALHGVSMSLASADGVNVDYITRLKGLIDAIDPFVVSDHLCWTGSKVKNVHDLLPFPHTKKSLQVVIDNVNKSQEILGRQILLENVSTYMTFNSSEFNEWDFVRSVAEKTEAKILLDVNNIYVSAINHGFDPYVFINAIPIEMVGQIHLAGFTDLGDILFDTHSKPVHEPVWPLFEEVIKKNGSIPYMMEWDEDIPDFKTVEAEVLKASSIWSKCHEMLQDVEAQI